MELNTHWAKEPPLGVVARAWFGLTPSSGSSSRAADPQPKEITPEQWEQFVGAEKAFAERYGR